MADEDVVELTPEQIQTEAGVSELVRMIRVLYQNTAGNLNDVRVFSGFGTPESAVAANVGSIYQRYDGAGGTTIYIKETGSGDTGWVPLNGVIGLDKGGTGSALTDPNDDRIFFWDDGAGATDWLDIGTNLTLTGTTLNADTQANTSNVIFSQSTSQDASETQTGTTPLTIWRFQFTKIAGVDTVTIHARLTAPGAADDEAFCNVDIGGQSNTVKTVTPQTGPVWATTPSTIDVSGLSDGTVYDGIVQVYNEKVGSDASLHACTLIGS